MAFIKIVAKKCIKLAFVDNTITKLKNLPSDLMCITIIFILYLNTNI